MVELGEIDMERFPTKIRRRIENEMARHVLEHYEHDIVTQGYEEALDQLLGLLRDYADDDWLTAT